ncbi:hypothetical protein [Tropicimonas sp. IMCC34043]|uniref:hypothetical protein n=1 Tax=Tropicimonas sp. IMCC34043 TaxID=2248760 RepID=UPI000E25CE20|nr:hypothetical protein [Tropicimonas sp. IMCC34043]
MKRFVAGLIALPAPALAHPGHGAAGSGHWLTQPDHLAVIALAVLAAPLAIGMAARAVTALRVRRKAGRARDAGAAR